MYRWEAPRGAAPHLRHMKIGDLVIHDGRELVLLGLEPMSVANGRAEVQDPVTLERWTVPIAELEPAPSGGRVSG